MSRSTQLNNNDPYGQNSPSARTTQDVGMSTMMWGESDSNYDNDHKSAGCCACSAQVSNALYGAIIVIGTILAMLAKFVTQKLNISYFNFCPKDSTTPIIRDLCVQNQTVYRISAVLATFFLLMAIVTFINRKFHYESWIFKSSILSGLFTVSFFIPGQFFAIYREIARWCSLFFIVTQVLVLVDLAHSLHENIVRHVGEEGEDSPTAFKARILYLGLSITSIIATIVGVVFLYLKYNPCALHATMITLTIILGVVVTALSLLDVVAKGLLPPTLLTAYCTLVTYQALTTNTTESCVVEGLTKSMPTWLMVVSFLASLLQISWMSIRAGQSNRMFVDSSITHYSKSPLSQSTNSNDPYGQNNENIDPLTQKATPYQSMDSNSNRNSSSDPDEGNPNPPRHWIFHLTLVTCAMYIAMILTGWGSEQATSINNPEASIQSFWIKMISVWLSFGLYGWTLLAPILFPDRDFT